MTEEKSRTALMFELTSEMINFKIEDIKFDLYARYGLKEFKKMTTVQLGDFINFLKSKNGQSETR